MTEGRAEMERLVIKGKDGSLYYYDTERGLKLESYEVTPMQRREVLERLHAYKDTGLTPEQIMELKERDTAKEPKVFDGHWYKCPTCGMYAGGLKGNFCHRCGQRLKWED